MTLIAALVRICDGGEEAASVVADVLRANPGWDARARADAARRLFATVVLQARLDLRAGVAAGERGGARAARRLGAYLIEEEGALDDALVASLTGLARSEIEELRRSLKIAASWPSDPTERLAAERSLPRWLAELWVREFGAAEADALAAACNEPGPITVRANLRAGDRDALAARLAAEGMTVQTGRWSPWALHVGGAGAGAVGRPNLFGSAAWRAGAFEVQDEGSQLVALCAAPRAGERRIVDYCAGAGGKTLALCALAGPGAELDACDVDARRLRDLGARLSRAGVGNVRAVDLAKGEAPRGGADVVLVDAPCSSLGTLRRSPDARWRTLPAALAPLLAQQRAILAAASAFVRPGGRLVYATCTLRRAENEEVAAEPLRGLRVLPVAELLPAELARALGAADTLTLLPHRHGTDGFFVAAWERVSPRKPRSTEGA